jgi:hypothetical protein
VVPSAAVMIGRWMILGCAEPVGAMLGVTRDVETLLARLLVAGDVPRFEPEAGDDLAQGGLVRRVVEVATDGVLDAGRIELGDRDAALLASGVQPELHGYTTSISVAPVIASSSSYVVE